MRLLSILFLLGLLSGCNMTEPTAPPMPEWRALFDGQTTAGWVNYNSDTIRDGWKVEDGALVIDGPGGDIVTVDEFQDFELELEWQVSEAGNSGIFYNVVDGLGAVYSSGPEMQVLDNTGHGDGKNPLTSAGACYALYAPPRDVTRPVGEWNEVRLISRGGEVEHWLNDTLLCRYTLGSDEWNALVAASKFKDMPEFGLSRHGRIALQDHGDRVAFRNIRIREFVNEASTAELVAATCICGTPEAAMEGCACPQCMGGDGGPESPDCVCDPIQVE